MVAPPTMPTTERSIAAQPAPAAALLGSPDFSPSPERPVGWRGDGTGKFTGANPPVKWGKVSKQMKGLRCQAKKPRDDRPAGVPAYHGSLTEWLVLE